MKNGVIFWFLEIQVLEVVYILETFYCFNYFSDSAKAKIKLPNKLNFIDMIQSLLLSRTSDTRRWSGIRSTCLHGLDLFALLQFL